MSGAEIVAQTVLIVGGVALAFAVFGAVAELLERRDRRRREEQRSLDRLWRAGKDR